MEMFRSQKGYDSTGPETDHLSLVVESVYEYVFQSKLPPPAPGVSSMWTDTNLYREIGIPAVDWGPSNLRKYPNRQTVEVEGLVQAAKIYSLIALEICGEAAR